MPEIHIAGKQFSIDSMKSKGPASLVERGFRPTEIGKNSEALFERGAEVVRFINQLAIGREYQLPTTHFFWVTERDASETIFIKTPIGDSETNNKSILLMFGASKELREEIQLKFMEKPTRESIRELLKGLLDASDNLVQESDLFVSTIAYMTTPANNLILQASRQLSAPFDVAIGMQHASYIDVRHLPHQPLRPEKTEVTPYQVQPTDEPRVHTLIHTQDKPIQIVDRPPSVIQELRRSYMDKQQVLPIETEDENALLDIDTRIVDRHIEGKFRGEVIIHGQKLTSPRNNLDGGNDYEMFPHEGVIQSMYKYLTKIDPSDRIKGFLEACYLDARNDREGTTSSYRKTPQELKFGDSLGIVHFQDRQNSNTTHIFLQTPNVDYDFMMRPTWFAKLCCSLPTEDWIKLHNLIRSNPVNAERFIQIAFDGLDNSTWRLPVNRVSIVDIDKYIPIHVLGGPKISGNIDFAMRQLAGQKLIDVTAVETIPFPRKLPALSE